MLLAPVPVSRRNCKRAAQQQEPQAFPNEVLLKILEAADTPVGVNAAVNRSLRRAVLCHDPRCLSLTIDPCKPSQLAAGLSNLAWLSHSSNGSDSSEQRRAGPLRLVLKHSDSDAAPSTGAATLAVRVLLHTPLRVVTHLELAFVNEISQADVDVLGASMPLLRCFELRHNASLTSLSLKALPKLKTAYVNDCSSLTQLNVSDCEHLHDLRCSNNKLTSLDVSGCTELQYLTSSHNVGLQTLVFCSEVACAATALCSPQLYQRDAAPQHAHGIPLYICTSDAGYVSSQRAPHICGEFAHGQVHVGCQRAYHRPWLAASEVRPLQTARAVDTVRAADAAIAAVDRLP